jgi:hypothetical protein
MDHAVVENKSDTSALLVDYWYNFPKIKTATHPRVNARL